MQRIIEYVKDTVMNDEEYVEEFDSLTDFIRSVKMFDRLGIEKSEENIKKIEQEVKNDLMKEINHLETILENPKTDDEIVLNNVKNEVEHLKKYVIDDFKAIEDFVENDDRNLERILVINKDNEIEERYDFNKAEVRASDKKILARSGKYYHCIFDCCDNCDHECYNEETEEYVCEENKDKTSCAVEQQLADQVIYNEC